MSRNRPIAPSERGKWLKQLEEGVGVTAITKAAKRDIRVIKRHLQMAEREREEREARQSFVRARLEEHQRDLLAEAGRLRALVASGSPLNVRPDDPLKAKLQDGLLSHLLRNEARAIRKYAAMAGDYADRQEAMAKELVGLSGAIGLKPALVSHNWPRMVAEVAEELAGGDVGWPETYNTSPERDGGHLHWQGYVLTRVPVDDATLGAVREAHRVLCEAAQRHLSGLRSEGRAMKKLGARIADGLDGYLLRRMMPGRCEYCPI